MLVKAAGLLTWGRRQWLRETFNHFSLHTLTHDSYLLVPSRSLDQTSIAVLWLMETRVEGIAETGEQEIIYSRGEINSKWLGSFKYILRINVFCPPQAKPRVPFPNIFREGLKNTFDPVEVIGKGQRGYLKVKYV